jgi:DegV family protein with EDD domain
MEKIGIITDEAADLTQDIIEKNQIVVVPVKLNWPELEKMPGNNNFQKMRELEKRGIESFGKTSQPSVKDFLDRYNLQLEKFEKIICVALTSKLSGTYNSAVQAKSFLKPEDRERVFIVDSLSVSASQALLVLKAVDLVKEGKTAEQIVKELEKFILKISFFVIVSDPKWLETSGRISHIVANLLRGLLKSGIRPLLNLKKGKLVPAGFKTDARDIPTALFKQFEAKTGKIKGKIRVVITHGDDLKGSQRLKEMVEGKFKNTEVVFMNNINNIVGAVSGPDAIVLSWCEK